jgi:hypothetical protein
LAQGINGLLPSRGAHNQLRIRVDIFYSSLCDFGLKHLGGDILRSAANCTVAVLLFDPIKVGAYEVIYTDMCKLLAYRRTAPTKTYDAGPDRFDKPLAVGAQKALAGEFWIGHVAPHI